MAKTKYEKLHCAAGDHQWDWPIKRGRKPANCPAHKPAPQENVRREISTDSMDRLVQRVVAEQRGRSGSSCSCVFEAGMTWDKLCAMGAGCTSPTFVCSTLDAVRRAADRAR